jgi:hypothetical protein
MNLIRRRARSPLDARFVRTHLVLAALAAACAAILGAGAVAAQEPQASQGRELEEIVVTARFREESLQRTPLAISAYTGEMLANNGATNVIDVADWAPNVVIDQLGSGWGPTLAASVRGLGYGDFKATSEPTVTIYIDDVVLGRPTGAILDLLDLERVEVLRGPQGTLFGKNAIGGVVRMISRKAGEGPQNADVEVTVGTYDRLDVRGTFDTTLIEDKLFSRVSYVAKRRNGWQNNVDFRCHMVETGRGALAGVGDGIVGWDTVNNVPIMGADYEIEPVEVPPLRSAMRGRVNMMVNLANDALGYIIPKSEWDNRSPYLYGSEQVTYGEIVSAGPETAPLLHRAFLELFAEASGSGEAGGAVEGEGAPGEQGGGGGAEEQGGVRAEGESGGLGQ